jgi:signal transduction histidine kinase
LEASRLKSTLLANVSHELRTPLGAVIGYAEMLYLGIFGDVTAEQAAIASEIVESGTYLTHMVNNLLDQAQLESGRFAIDIAPFNASDLFEPVEAQLQLLAHKKGLTLTFGIDQNVPPRLFGAQDRLQQIVINLAANAIKFTENGGISVRLIRTNKTFWGIQVSDTGVGISAELQQKIFQPFEQLDNSTTRQQSGSGLGLSIVQQLTDLMGGYITLKSDLGFGSVFTAHFPLTPNS